MTLVEACPVCSKPAAESRVFCEREADRLLECPGCGFIFASVRRSEAELQELYADNYYSVENTLEGSGREQEHERNRVLYSTVIADILRRYPQRVPTEGQETPRSLDYGCGPGYFLAECRDRGFEVLGLELSTNAARYARERLDLEVRTSPETELGSLPKDTFELVTAWAVLEHAQQPRQLLEGLVRALAPGGLLCLTVPNMRCWRYLLEGPRWFNMRNPTHLGFFRRQHLEKLLRELGLGGVCRPVFWGGRPGFGPLANALQYAVRLLGMGSDLRLYATKRP